jgi:hypothetical protein
MDAGTIFGLVWLIIFTPIYFVAAFWFYVRRDIQPIKARSPYLVLLCDAVLILYSFVSSVQRLLGDSYPCYLNLWASYVGTLVLCNTYLIRCFHLFFKYFLTQEKLNRSLEIDKGGLDDSFFIRYRNWTNVSFLAKIQIAFLLLLLIPCAVLSYTNASELRGAGGDNCDKAWGNDLLAAYAAGYILLFLAFGWNLRQVVDGFMIKQELRFTAFIGVAVVIPWFIFNNVFQSVNTSVFPFSTFVILVGIFFAMAASTGLPLYRSIYKPLALDDLHVAEDIATLKGLLSDPDGFNSFKNFLSHEFSVENILFWREVEDFRQKKARGVGSLELLGEAQSMYAKYIIPGAPFEVNLPATIVNDLQRRLKAEFGGLAASARESDSNAKLLPETFESDTQTPTIFDAAQKNIFHLMETDSYQRYIASQDYKQLSLQYTTRAKKKEVLVQMNVL